MANAGKGTNGSQFFLVYKDTQLGSDYTIWGKITKGLDLLNKVGVVGAYKINGTDNKPYYTNDGFPIQPIEMRKVSVK
jgi:peptidyl-prolyl cis-trans isomerase B (cyclophilin B)